jgi:hypothetical protein
VRESARRCPDGHLLEFALPCGNGKRIETIDMVSPINPRFPATINSPKNVIKGMFSTEPKLGFPKIKSDSFSTELQLSETLVGLAYKSPQEK